jgi:hypothetical protein
MIFWTLKQKEHMNFDQLQFIKQGWARINLHYTLTDDEFDYFMLALNFLSKHAYKFLPLY